MADRCRCTLYVGVPVHTVPRNKLAATCDPKLPLAQAKAAKATKD